MINAGGRTAMITTRDVPALTSAACRRSSALTHRDYADPLVLLVGRGRSGPAGPKGSCSPPCPPSCGSGWDILSCSTSPVCDSSGLRFLASMGDSELIMIGHDATSSGLDARLLYRTCWPLRALSGSRGRAETGHRDGAARGRDDGTEDQRNGERGQDQHDDDAIVAGGCPVRRWSPRPLLRPWCRAAFAAPVALHA